MRRRPTMARVAKARKRRQFDPKTFLTVINGGRKILAFPKKRAIFVQGGLSDAVFYIQKGRLRLTVLWRRGREAPLGFLTGGVSLGEGGLPGKPFGLCSE